MNKGKKNERCQGQSILLILIKNPKKIFSFIRKLTFNEQIDRRSIYVQEA